MADTLSNLKPIHLQTLMALARARSSDELSRVGGPNEAWPAYQLQEHVRQTSLATVEAVLAQLRRYGLADDSGLAFDPYSPPWRITDFARGLLAFLEDETIVSR